MAGTRHSYKVRIHWTGNLGEGTSGYRSYSRDHTVTADERQSILASSDPAFRGDPLRWDPERLLVASLSQCHMLWFLHLCADAGIVVVAYDDLAEGEMRETENGGGHFTQVTLRPEVAVADASMLQAARELHARAHELCFIANSVNFPVRHEPQIQVA